MNNLKLLLLILLFNLTSCEDKRVFKNNAVILTEDNAPPLQYLEAERIQVPEVECMNSYMNVYKDTILLVMNAENPNPTLLKIMNLSTMQVINNFYPKGNGPYEILGMSGFVDHNQLLVMDIFSERVSIFNIDSALINGESYKPKMFTPNDYSWVTSCVLSDSILLVKNRWYVEDAGQFNTNDRTPEFYFYNLNGGREYEFVHNSELFNSTANACLVANPKLKQIFCAYNRWPKFKLLDYELKVEKTIYGPDDFFAVEYGESVRGGELVVYDYNVYSEDIAANDEYIFVYNKRSKQIPEESFASPTDVTEACIELSIENGELFQFDWDGNLVGRYKVDGNAFYTLSLSEQDPKLIYFTGYNEDRELCLFKTHLP